MDLRLTDHCSVGARVLMDLSFDQVVFQICYGDSSIIDSLLYYDRDAEYCLGKLETV